MSWYGWIPILTSRLLLTPAKDKLRLKSIPTDNPNEFILNPKIDTSKLGKSNEKGRRKYLSFFNAGVRSTIKASLDAPPNCDFFFYLRDFDDVHRQSWKIVAVAFDRAGGHVRNIGIFEFPDEPNPIAIAAVQSIEETGLTKYEMKAGMPQIHSKQLFGEIRDIYHEHIYTPHGDFPLRPVETASENKDDAIIQIFRQYQNKIIQYHSLAKKLLEQIEVAYGVASQRHFHNLLRVLCSAKGEMNYALSFINHFHVSPKEKRSLKIAISSLENLELHCGSVTNLRAITTNWMVLILTLTATLIAGYHAGRFIFPEHPRIFAVGTAFVTFIFLRYIAHRQTKKRSIPQVSLNI